MAKKKNNHHMYQEQNSGIWYFQKKVKGISNTYKLSLETTSVVEARRKRDEYLKQIEIHGHIPSAEAIDVSGTVVFGEVALKWSEIIKTRIEETTFNGYRKAIRIAEASGLKWKHVNFDEGVIEIQKNLVRGEQGKIIYKKPKTDSSIRDVKLPSFVIEALHEQHKRTWKGKGEDFVFLNKLGRPVHRHTLNHCVITPTLERIGVDTKISIKDTRASYITNSLDQNERMSFIQAQVGHTTTRMIVDHYYRHTPASDDGCQLEKAWNSTSILPEAELAKT